MKSNKNSTCNLFAPPAGRSVQISQQPLRPEQRILGLVVLQAASCFANRLHSSFGCKWKELGPSVWCKTKERIISAFAAKATVSTSPMLWIPGAATSLHPGKTRAAFESQTPKLSVRETEATLTFQDGRETLTFDLHRDPASRARERVRELLFGLAARVRELERRLGDGDASAAAPPPIGSPRKDIQTDPNPAKIRTGSSKRKLPGESLINPGFVRKKTPTGVNFEDA
ncbi:protein PAXX-like isoform X2 [Podarcis muralis]